MASTSVKKTLKLRRKIREKMADNRMRSGWQTLREKQGYGIMEDLC